MIQGPYGSIGTVYQPLKKEIIRIAPNLLENIGGNNILNLFLKPPLSWF